MYVPALFVQGLPELVPRHWEMIAGYNYRRDDFSQPLLDSILSVTPRFPRSPEVRKVEVIYLAVAEVS